jgi:hypothetical protein
MGRLPHSFRVALGVGAVDQAHLFRGVGDEEADQLLHQAGTLPLEHAQLVQGLLV